MKTSYSTISAVKRFFNPMPLLFAVALLFGTQAYGNEVAQLNGKTMGTFWNVTLAHDLDQSALQAAQTAIEKRLLEVNQSMSTYIPDSELSKLNQNASLEPQMVSDELAYVLAQALKISEASDGAYDVTVMPLVNLWGFGPKKTDRKPSDEEIQATLAYVGYQHLDLQGNQLRKAKPEVAIDLSSIAKGYGVDAVAETLSALGYRDFLVDIGGETRASGQKYGKDWRIGIETPVIGSNQSASVVVSLANGRALATSGNYRNFIDYEGIRAVHTLDPRTGQPKSSKLLSASVVADNCMIADGYATALMALGDEQAFDFAEKQGLAVILIYAGEGKDFVVKHSSAFKALLGE